MRFELVEPPRLEDPANRGSALRLAFDTFDQGRIDFSLGLEQVTSESGVNCGRTYNEFAEMEQHLQATYGVKMALRPIDGSAPEQLNSRTARNLPRDRRRESQF